MEKSFTDLKFVGSVVPRFWNFMKQKIKKESGGFNTGLPSMVSRIYVKNKNKNKTQSKNLESTSKTFL